MSNSPFKVHDLKTDPPKIGQANDEGKVLFWSRSIGWHIGNFQLPWDDDTAWTYAPQPLLEKASREELLEAQFKKVCEENGWTKEQGCNEFMLFHLKAAYLLGTNSII